MNERVYFGIYVKGQGSPTAVFSAIEDAIEWACEHFELTFRIEKCPPPVFAPAGQDGAGSDGSN